MYWNLKFYNRRKLLSKVEHRDMVSFAWKGGMKKTGFCRSKKNIKLTDHSIGQLKMVQTTFVSVKTEKWERACMLCSWDPLTCTQLCILHYHLLWSGEFAKLSFYIALPFQPSIQGSTSVHLLLHPTMRWVNSSKQESHMATRIISTFLTTKITSSFQQLIKASKCTKITALFVKTYHKLLSFFDGGFYLVFHQRNDILISFKQCKDCREIVKHSLLLSVSHVDVHQTNVTIYTSLNAGHQVEANNLHHRNYTWRLKLLHL